MDSFLLYNKFNPYLVPKDQNKLLFSEAIIYEKNYDLILIASEFKFGNIYLWDFKKNIVLYIINIDYNVINICLWDNNHIYASSNDPDC